MSICQALIKINSNFWRNLTVIVIISTLFLSNKSYSQNKHFHTIDNWTFGIKTGSNHFSGDLSSNSLFFPSINVDFRNGNTFGFFLRKRISNTSCLTFDSDISHLKDLGSKYYPEYFTSNIWQFNICVDTDLFYLFFDASSKLKILPYAGIGMTLFHTSVFSHSDNKLIRDSSYDSSIGLSSLSQKKKSALNIPIGLNVTQQLGEFIELGVDFRVNNTLTDKLDGTIGGDNSSIYGNQPSLEPIPYNSWYDAWGYIGVSASYRIPSTHKKYVRSVRYL